MNQAILEDLPWAGDTTEDDETSPVTPSAASGLRVVLPTSRPVSCRHSDGKHLPPLNTMFADQFHEEPGKHQHCRAQEATSLA